MGILDEATYKKTLAEPPPAGQRYGDMLLAKRLCTEDQMRLALKAQVRRKLHRLFFLNDGSYEFVAGEHDQGVQKTESLRIHPARAIYHGVRSAWNAERLRGALFLLDGKAIKCTLDNEGVARYGVGPDDGRVAELLRQGYWTLPDLVEAAGLPPQPVHALVYALYITEGLDIKSAAEVPRLRKRTDTPLPPNATAATPSTMKDLSGALQMPSQRDATAAEGRLAGAVRCRIEPSGAFKMPSGAYKFPSPPHASSQRVRVPTPPSVTGLDQGAPDVDSVRKQLIAKAAVVETQNLFEVLEIPTTATKDEVKQAYFVAAKRYHPDRLVSMGLESLRRDVEKIFRRVSRGVRHPLRRRAPQRVQDDARQAQGRRRRRARQGDEDARGGHGAPPRRGAAQEERLPRRHPRVRGGGEPRSAERRAPGVPDVGARLRRPDDATPTPRACCNQAVKLSPKCAQAYYYLGICLKEEKDIDRAYGMFRKAHELNTRLLDAEREMRAHQHAQGEGEVVGRLLRPLPQAAQVDRGYPSSPLSGASPCSPLSAAAPPACGPTSAYHFSMTSTIWRACFSDEMLKLDCLR